MHDHLDRSCGAEAHPVLHDQARGGHDPQDPPDTVSEIDQHNDPRHRARWVVAWRRGMDRRKRKDAEWQAHRRQLAERGAKRPKAVTAAMLYTTLDALDRAHSPTLRARAKELRRLVFQTAYGPLNERMTAGETLRRLTLGVLPNSTWSPYDHRAVQQFHDRVVLYRIK
ncbi:MAG: hypothetical protein ACYC1S_05300 [Gemmatimonadaceae bacterium]